MKKIKRSLDAVKVEIADHNLDLLSQVAKSKDELSVALGPVFANAIEASQEEINKARLRKERGNPPGKKNDPLGDKITWEQILNHFERKKVVDHISRR